MNSCKKVMSSGPRVYYYNHTSNKSPMLLQPGVNQTASLPNVDLATFTGDAVYFWCPQSQVVLYQPKETRHLPGKQAYRLDVVPRQHPANAAEYRATLAGCCIGTTSSLLILLVTCFHAGFLCSLFFRPWRWRRYVPPKCQLTLNVLHGVISQKMVLFLFVKRFLPPA
jgi:hypothetical protein